MIRQLSASAARWASVSLLAAISLAQSPVGLAKYGPLDPVSRFPKWFQDIAPQGGRSLVLEQITSFPGVIDPPAPAQPVVVPTNYPGETFYFMAAASMADGANAAFWEGALEGTFVSGNPVDGEQILFSRIRIRITGLQNGATYTIRHPYGTETEVAAGGGINMTRDIGIGAPGDFTGALHGDVGPFLVPASMPDSALVAGAMIGDMATLTTVRRGLNNFLEIEGPGIEDAYPTFAGQPGDNKVSIDQFTLLGRVANQLGAQVEQSYYSRKLGQTSVNVWARSASSQSLVVSANSGTLESPSWGPAVPMVENAQSGEYFARLELGAGLPPAQVRVSNLSDNPVTSALSVGDRISDLVTIESAIYTIGGDLVIRARSSDEVNPPNNYTATSSDKQGSLGLANSLVGTGANLFEGRILMPATATAPSQVEVASPQGYTTRIAVEVQGMGSTGTVDPVIAVAGANQTVRTGDLVQLNGGGSLGPITSYFWQAPLGVLLSNPLVADPTFVAPTVPGGLADLVFTLTVSDGVSTAASSVTITVNEPQQQPADVLTIVDARYDARKTKWRASGQASVLANQVINLYLGNATAPDLARFVGSAVVDATGAWQYQGGNGSAAQNVRMPISGVTHVWALSTFDNPGNVPASFVPQVR